jgi:hypothetical protein
VKYCDRACRLALKYAYEQNEIRDRLINRGCDICGKKLGTARPRAKWFCSRKCGQRAWYLRCRDMELMARFGRACLDALRDDDRVGPVSIRKIGVDVDQLKGAVERLERDFL